MKPRSERMRRKSDLKAGMSVFQGTSCPAHGNRATRAFSIPPDGITRTRRMRHGMGARYGWHDGARPDERHVDGRHRPRHAAGPTAKIVSSSVRPRSFPILRRSAVRSKRPGGAPRRSSSGRNGRAGLQHSSATSPNAMPMPSRRFCEWRRRIGASPTSSAFMARPCCTGRKPALTVQLGDGERLAQADRHSRRLRHARQRYAAGRAGRAAGAGLPCGAGAFAGAAICRRLADGVRQHRRHLQHHLCRRRAILSPSTPAPATR